MALVCKTNPRLEASTSWGVIVSILPRILMRILLVFMILLPLFSLAEDKCIQQSEINEALNSGMVDTLFKYRVLLEETLFNLETLNGVRATLISTEQNQLTYMKIIDKQTNTKLQEIATSLFLAENLNLLLKKKKRILVFISTIETMRKESYSQITIDNSYLVDLKNKVESLKAI